MKIIALSGGIGGAKLALGLNHNISSSDLLLIANVGDDFSHHGLAISPDIDTLVYTLSGLNDQERGWGLAGESWAFMGALKTLGGESWFNLGDKDLAMHVLRSERLRQGDPLSAITADISAQLGIAAQIIPATDDAVPTIVDTVEHGPIAFQSYFVERQAAPTVQGFTFENIAAARPAPGVLEGIAAADRIIICPSNPFISIDPVLAVPGLREAMRTASAPVIAVSPIVAGQAIKGPTAKMFRELGVTPSVVAVAERYKDVVDVMVLDEQDSGAVKDVEALGMVAVTAQTVMQTLADKTALAKFVVTVPVS